MLKVSVINISLRILKVIIENYFIILSSRLLGQDMAGRIGYVYSWATFCSMFFLLGFHIYFNQQIPRLSTDKRKELFTKALFFITSIFSTLSIFLYFYNRIDLVPIILASYLFSLSELVYHYYMGIKKLNISSFVMLSLTFAHLALFAFTIHLGFDGVFSYLSSLFLTHILILGMASYPLISTFSKATYSLDFKRMFPFYLQSVIIGIYSPVFKIFQKYFFNFSSLYILSFAMTFVSLLNMFARSFTQIYSPYISESFAKKEYDKVGEYFSKIVTISSYILIPALAFIFINGKELLHIFIGDTSYQSYIIFSLISLSGLFYSFSQPLSTLLVVTKFSNYEVVNGFIRIVVSLIFIILFRRYEFGIAAAFTLTEFIVTVVRYLEVKKEFDLKIFTFNPVVVSVFVLSTLISVTISYFNLSIIWGILTLLFTFATLFVIVAKESRDYTTKI